MKFNFKSVNLRFYEELNDFLPDDRKKIKFEHQFIDRTSVKDLIESFGVPHTEVDMILINSKSVSFDYIINDKDDISVYPVFESFDISDVQHLRPEPLRDPKFVCDVHLGKLARNLRMLGFDTFYKNDLIDDEIVKISEKEKRTILTKDLELLKRTEVSHGYYLRNDNQEEQIKEVIKRFHLNNLIKEFSRCLDCNTILVSIEKDKIINELPPKVKERQQEFYTCSSCGKIYWKGSHFEKMLLKVKSFKEIH